MTIRAPGVTMVAGDLCCFFWLSASFAACCWKGSIGDSAFEAGWPNLNDKDDAADSVTGAEGPVPAIGWKLPNSEEPNGIAVDAAELAAIFAGGPVIVDDGAAGEYPGGVSEYAGEVGEYTGEVGEYVGEVGEYAGEVGEYAGEVGEYPGEVGE